MLSARRAAAVVGAVIVTLAATMPVAAEDPVITGDEFEVYDPRVTFYTDDTGLHVIGQIEPDGASRRLGNPRVTLSFRDASGASVHVTGTPTMLTTTINGTDVPWHAVIAEEDVAGATTMEWWWHSDSLPSKYPVGGLDVSPATLDGMTATGTVENDGTVPALDVVVYGTLQDVVDPEGGRWLDTAASATIPSLAPGASATYTITFNSAAEPGTLVEVVAETMSGPYMTNWENHFFDLPPYSAYYESIIWLARERIVTGCSGGNFCPYRGVTRAQLAAFIDRAIDLPNTDVDYFTDDDGHWAEDSINRLAEAGIVHGCAEGNYCPTGRVNRGQLAKFLVLAYNVPPSGVDAFTDDGNSTTEAYHNALAAAGLAFGCNTFTGRYCPNRNLVRREMAAFLYRAEHFEP